MGRLPLTARMSRTPDGRGAARPQDRGARVEQKGAGPRCRGAVLGARRTSRGSPATLTARSRGIRSTASSRSRPPWTRTTCARCATGVYRGRRGVARRWRTSPLRSPCRTTTAARLRRSSTSSGSAMPGSGSSATSPSRTRASAGRRTRRLSRPTTSRSTLRSSAAPRTRPRPECRSPRTSRSWRCPTEGNLGQGLGRWLDAGLGPARGRPVEVAADTATNHAKGLGWAGAR